MEQSGKALLRLGTSSFTAKGWERSFYPRGTQTSDYLKYYATQFDALMDAQEQLNEFRRNTEPLAEKRAVLLLQFPYFSSNTLAQPGQTAYPFLRVRCVSA